MKCAVAAAHRRFCCSFARVGESFIDGYARLLRKCGDECDLEEGRRIHHRILSEGASIKNSAFLGNLLVQMYGKCGSAGEAQAAFDAILQRNAYSWSLLMGALAQNGYHHQVVQVFGQMLQKGIRVKNEVIFLQALVACSKIGNLHLGKSVHASLIETGVRSELLDSSLVSMYGKCGCLANAQAAFATRDKKKDHVATWASMIGAFAQNGQPEKALHLFNTMEMEPNEITFMSVIEACTALEDLEHARRTYERVVSLGLLSETIVGNALIGMFGRCGSSQDALKVFSAIPRNVISWNSMMAAYAQNGNCKHALELYQRMGPEGIKADAITFVAALSLCAQLGDLAEGRRVYARILESGYFSDIIVQNGVVNMLGKCGKVEEARAIFDAIPVKNPSTWNSMLISYARAGHARECIELYKSIDLKKKDFFTFTSVLYACGSVSALEDGRMVHNDVRETGLEADIAVGNSLVTMYSKCGSLAEAREVFDSMKQRDVVSWTAMITGYAQNELGREALEIFKQMDVDPNDVTFISAIDACSAAKDLTQGRVLHSKARALLGSLHGSVGNALVNMYSACGSLQEACKVFWEVQTRNVVCWSTLVSAHARHGAGARVQELLCDMCLSGVLPDFVTFINILVACSHAGLLDEGIWLFRFLSSDCGLPPRVKHYKCMMTILARAGWLDEAAELMVSMPFEADGDALMALFSFLRTSGELEKGLDAAQDLIDCLASKGPAPYVLLANLCTQVYQEVSMYDT